MCVFQSSLVCVTAHFRMSQQGGVKSTKEKPDQPLQGQGHRHSEEPKTQQGKCII